MLAFRYYLAAAMESTFRFLPASSNVPTTVTFLAANFSGVFWSLSTYDFLALASYSTYLPFMPLTHWMTHLASLPIFMSVWSASAHMLSVMTPVKVPGPAAKAMAAAAKTTAICFFIGFSRSAFDFLSYRTVYGYLRRTMLIVGSLRRALSHRRARRARRVFQRLSR